MSHYRAQKRNARRGSAVRVEYRGFISVWYNLQGKSAQKSEKRRERCVVDEYFTVVAGDESEWDIDDGEMLIYTNSVIVVSGWMTAWASLGRGRVNRISGRAAYDQTLREWRRSGGSVSMISSAGIAPHDESVEWVKTALVDWNELWNSSFFIQLGQNGWNRSKSTGNVCERGTKPRIKRKLEIWWAQVRGRWLKDTIPHLIAWVWYRVRIHGQNKLVESVIFSLLAQHKSLCRTQERWHSLVTEPVQNKMKVGSISINKDTILRIVGQMVFSREHGVEHRVRLRS